MHERLTLSLVKSLNFLIVSSQALVVYTLLSYKNISFHNSCHYILGEENALTLSEVMKFITGCSSKPASGLPGKITVIFEKYCPENCRCKPTTSSCDIQIEVALHYTTKRDMMIALTDACRESKGMLRY